MAVNLSPTESGFDRSLPPAEAITEPAIRRAVETWQEAQEHAHRVAEETERLRVTRPVAVEKDATATADALAAGKPDPGAKNAERHDRQMAEAERQSEARAILVQRARTSMVEAFAEHADAWEADLAAAFEKRQAAVRQAVATVSTEAAALGQVRALLAFSRGHRFNPSAGAGVEQHVADLLALANAPAPGEPSTTTTAPLVLVAPPAA